MLTQVLSHDSKDAEALTLWDRILPSWHIVLGSIDSSVVFAHRKAGIAAARNGEFARSSNYFFDGVAKADAAGLAAIAAGLLADSAFSEWRAGNSDRAISLFIDVMKRLEALPNSKADIPSFRVRKVVGQMLLHISHTAIGLIDEQAYAPNIGSASDPEAGERWLELPISSAEHLWLLLSQAEAALNVNPQAFAELPEPIPQSTIPTVRWFAAELQVKHTIRSGNLSDLPAIAQEFARVHRIAAAGRGHTSHPIEVPDERLISSEAELEDVGIAMPVLVAGLLSLVSRDIAPLRT